MNIEHLNELVHNYMEQFNLVNNDDHHEYYKWEAFKEFQQVWDLDASDFAVMFKLAVSNTENLINNHIVQPANGIVKLPERSELTEQVRALFRTLLYTEDNGNIMARQERIERFVDDANALLAVHEPGKSKYQQDFRSGLFYLNLFAPGKNYLFKATQARAFMQCVEFEDDFGRGSAFNLETYYTMCDQLVSYIEQTEELKQLHKERLTDTMCTNDNWHLLAFDLIYCALTYDLYKGIDILVPQKAISRKQIEREKNQATMQELGRLQEQLFDLQKERDLYDDFSAIGLELHHKSFGVGKVVKQDNKYLVVHFEDQERNFLLPDSFKTPLLTLPDPEIAEYISSMNKLDKEIDSVEREIAVLKSKIKRLSIELK